jgi:hypothetical protein
MAVTETYEETLINYVWFIEFERVEGGVKLLRNYRLRFNNPDRPTSLGAGHTIERTDGSRIVESVEIVPYKTNKKEVHKVVNPKHVFSYESEAN